MRPFRDRYGASGASPAASAERPRRSRRHRLRTAFRKRYGTGVARHTVAVTIAAVPEPSLSIALLGPPVVEVDGRPLAGRHAQGDGAARLPRDRGPSAAPRHDRLAALARERPRARTVGAAADALDAAHGARRPLARDRPRARLARRRRDRARRRRAAAPRRRVRDARAPARGDVRALPRAAARRGRARPRAVPRRLRAPRLDRVRRLAAAHRRPARAASSAACSTGWPTRRPRPASTRRRSPPRGGASRSTRCTSRRTGG